LPEKPDRGFYKTGAFVRLMLLTFLLLSVLQSLSAATIVDGTYRLRALKPQLDATLRQQYLSSSVFRAQIKEASRNTKLVPNESELGFQVYNFAANTYEYRVGRLVAQGRRCHLFVERENANFYGDHAAAIYAQIVDNFDNKVFRTVDSWFGRPVVPAGFNLPDDRVYIFLVDIRDSFGEGYVAGYFDHRDLEGLFGNQKPVFFMDLTPGDPGDTDDKGNQFYRTLAHELQHMVNFSIQLSSGCEEQDRWLDEGLSMFCEYVYSGEIGKTTERWPPEPHFARFLENPAVNLVSNSKESWFQEDYLFRQYGASFAFVTWLVEKYGGESTSLQQQFIRELIRMREKGVVALDKLLAAVDADFSHVFANFIMALHVEESDNPLWNFADKKRVFGENLAAMLPLRFVKHYFASNVGSFVGGNGQVIPNSVLLEEIYGKDQVNLSMSFEEGMTPYLAELSHDKIGSIRPLVLDERGKIKMNVDFSGQRRYFILPVALNPELATDKMMSYSYKTDANALVLYPVPHPVFSDQILIFLKSFSGPIETPPTLRIFFGNLIETPEFIAADSENTTYMAHYQLPGDGRGQAVCYYGEDSCSFSFSALRYKTGTSQILPLGAVFLEITAGTDAVAILSESDSITVKPDIEVLAGPYDIVMPPAASATVFFDSQISKSPQAGWCRVDDSGAVAEWHSIQEFSENRRAPVTSSGRYFLLNDRVAPVLELPRIRQIDANRLLINIQASDDLSGVDYGNLRVLANNRQVKAQYFSENSALELLVASLDPGENQLTVELTDRAGNMTRASIVGSGLASAAAARTEVFPNPCRRQAHIRMNIIGAPMVNQAEVKIYDVAGHHLVTLSMQQETASAYGAEWDLRNKGGKLVSNGVYFYRIAVSADSQRFKASGKITILR